jgi:hypothetical protein
MTDETSNNRTPSRVAGAVLILSQTDQPGRWHYHSQRPGDAAAEHRNENRPFTEKRYRRGFRYNLGLIEANQATADVRAERDAGNQKRESESYGPITKATRWIFLALCIRPRWRFNVVVALSELRIVRASAELSPGLIRESRTTNSSRPGSAGRTRSA